MEDVLTFLVKALALAATLFYLFVRDWSNAKNKADKARKKYLFKKDYWPDRNDDVLKLLSGSFLIGAFLGFYVGAEAIHYFVPGLKDFPIGESGLEAFMVIACTLSGGLIIEKILNGKGE
jgi:polyferredoxin